MTGRARFHQVGSHLLERVPALLGRERRDPMLFGRGQGALEAAQEETTDQVGVESLGPRPMNSCMKRLMPSQVAASTSPCVFMTATIRDEKNLSRIKWFFPDGAS
jgi:hypothetical protein